MNVLEVYAPSKKGAMPEFKPDLKQTDPTLYLPSPELCDAVNVAIWLGKPLLITGEPGTGKTQLAYSVANCLGLNEPLRFNVRTTSVASDLFYKYDAIRHFQVNNEKNAKALSADEIEKQFIKYQPLGTAIQSGIRHVVLIDEIDKAPRDLPNDILNILEDMNFDVPEIDKTFTSAPARRPVIIFTSNSEKNLPDAFLRRCVYYHIQFPNDNELLGIISAKIETQRYSADDLLKILIPHFRAIRNILKRKKPATAELINWIVLLERKEIGPEQFPAINPETLATDFSAKDIAVRKKIFESLIVLIKTEEDRSLIQSYFQIPKG